MKKIAIVFPGQGSHFVGMYKNLYDNFEIVRQTICEAEQITGVNLSELCLKGPLSTLSRVENAHLAILAFGVAAFRVFVSESGITPDFCAGHSLGEYTALVCAGVINFSDALKLVQIRSEISKEVQKVTDGGMTIVDGIASEVVAEVCKKQQELGKKVYLSCFNSNTQTAISGLVADVEETENILSKEQGIITPLFNSAPFHCPIMKAGAKKFKEAVSEITFRDSRYPVIANYTGLPYQGKKDNIRNLVNHLTSTVKWNQIMNYFADKQVDIIVDLSARNIFDNILKENKIFQTICFGIKIERDKLFDLLDEDYKNEKMNFISKSIVAAISTPNQNPKTEGYEKVVGSNYETLLTLKNRFNAECNNCPKEMKIAVFGALKQIWEYKKVDESEQQWWMEQIADETASTYENLF